MAVEIFHKKEEEIITYEKVDDKPSNYDISDFDKSFKKNKSIVKRILENYPETTNCDNLLCLKFWDETRQIELNEDNNRFIITILKKNIKNLTPAETITRCRRQLNAEGIGLPTDESVYNKRIKNQEIMKNYFKFAKKEGDYKPISFLP